MTVDEIHLENIQNPQIVIDFLPNLVHRISCEVDIGFAQLSSRPAYILHGKESQMK